MSLDQSRIRSICVFCGSNSGAAPVYRHVAAELGADLARRNITLVYGGANVGLMGVLADSALANGGRVIGVLPSALADRELAHNGLAELHLVGSMHERKALMFEQSDAFITLPGGYGTLDELFEILTWAQLGMHTKPTALLNIEGYFDSLIQLLDHMVQERLLRTQHRDMLLVAASVRTAFDALEQYKPVSTAKWIDPPES